MTYWDGYLKQTLQGKLTTLVTPAVKGHLFNLEIYEHKSISHVMAKTL